MSSLYRSAIKGTFAIYSDNKDNISPLNLDEQPYSVQSPTEGAIELRPSPVVSSVLGDMDPLVLVVQLKKELDDERRRAGKMEDEMQLALSSAKSAARREAEQLKDAVKRAEGEVEEERARRLQLDEDSTAERRRLKEELERQKLNVRSKESEMEELRGKTEAEKEEAHAKVAAMQDLLRQEQSNRVSREAVAERKFSMLHNKLQVLQSSYEDAKAAAGQAQMEFRKELDEAHLRHSDTCQQLLESEQVRSRIAQDNARLVEDLETTVAQAEAARNRLRSEYEARLSAEMEHADQERSDSVDEVRRASRQEVKKVEAEYRERLDEAKHRLSSILRSKKTKYEGKRAELEKQVSSLRKQLQKSEEEKDALRARLARLLGKASGIIENHCSTTKRLMNDGRESVASFYSGALDDDRASFAPSESWSLPNAPRPDSPPLPPPSIPELNL